MGKKIVKSGRLQRQFWVWLTAHTNKANCLCLLCGNIVVSDYYLLILFTKRMPEVNAIISIFWMRQLILRVRLNNFTKITK